MENIWDARNRRIKKEMRAVTAPLRTLSKTIDSGYDRTEKKVEEASWGQIRADMDEALDRIREKVRASAAPEGVGFSPTWDEACDQVAAFMGIHGGREELVDWVDAARYDLAAAESEWIDVRDMYTEPYTGSQAMEMADVYAHLQEARKKVSQLEKDLEKFDNLVYQVIDHPGQLWVSVESVFETPRDHAEN